jgi:hypothetical protein
MPVSPAMQEAEVGGVQSKASHGQKLQTLSEKWLKQKGLSSNPCTAKKKKKQTFGNHI